MSKQEPTTLKDHYRTMQSWIDDHPLVVRVALNTLFATLRRNGCPVFESADDEEPTSLILGLGDEVLLCRTPAHDGLPVSYQFLHAELAGNKGQPVVPAPPLSRQSKSGR